MAGGAGRSGASSADQSGEPLENSQQVTRHMQQLLERSDETTVERATQSGGPQT
ncbi:hypothetical protein M8494_16215 [Serratia ureilytica]